jgi:hypothetical protein
MPDTQIKAIVRDLERVSERVIAKITLDVVANLTDTGKPWGTPVDVGWARANWVPSIGSPVSKNLRDVPSTSANAAAAQAEQRSAVARIATGYRLDQGKVFISNNVPYILRLNDGSSNQAPAGFVQNAIRKAVTEDIRGFTG